MLPLLEDVDVLELVAEFVEVDFFEDELLDELPEPECAVDGDVFVEVLVFGLVELEETGGLKPLPLLFLVALL